MPLRVRLESPISLVFVTPALEQAWRNRLAADAHPLQLSSLDLRNADAGDPIGGCNVTPAGFAAMTGLLQAVAPIALVLEVSTHSLTAQLHLQNLAL